MTFWAGLCSGGTSSGDTLLDYLRATLSGRHSPPFHTRLLHRLAPQRGGQGGGTECWDDTGRYHLFKSATKVCEDGVLGTHPVCNVDCFAYRAVPVKYEAYHEAYHFYQACVKVCVRCLLQHLSDHMSSISRYAHAFAAPSISPYVHTFYMCNAHGWLYMHIGESREMLRRKQSREIVSHQHKP